MTAQRSISRGVPMSKFFRRLFAVVFLTLLAAGGGFGAYGGWYYAQQLALAQVAVIVPAFLFGLIVGFLWALKENS